jgi:hypothetical protein
MRELVSHQLFPNRLTHFPDNLALGGTVSDSQLVYTWIRVNDPAAGSPTATLLRLLLPLNIQVCGTSRHAIKETQ